MIKAILAWSSRDPKKLGQTAAQGLQVLRSRIHARRALEGTWQDEHLFALKQSLQMYEFYHKQIAECDKVIEDHLKTLARPEKPRPLPERTKQRQSRRKNDLDFEARQRLYDMTGVDLTAIEGIEANTAFVVLSEIGTDMSRWHSEKAFGAWLGLAPNPKKSGGKLRSARTRPGVNRAAQALRLAGARPCTEARAPWEHSSSDG